MSIVKKLAASALAALAVYKARDLAADAGKAKPAKRAKRAVKKTVAKSKTKAKAAVRRGTKRAKPT
jgi:hypothetical protein